MQYLEDDMALHMKTKQSLISLDGSIGEGGGQILRTALSLSVITGQSFSINRIRAGRRKPGLLRQHLACVRAAASVCDAPVSGDSLGSESLTFAPGPLRAFRGEFAIGSAGSTALVLQTILPILWHAKEASEVILTGGTHALAAPCFDYLKDVYHPVTCFMGADWSLTLERHGFFPAGGGRVHLLVRPCFLQPIELCESEGQANVSAEIIVSRGIRKSVVERETLALGKELGLTESDLSIREVSDSVSPGNVVLLRVTGGKVGTTIAAYGERGKRAELVVREAARKMKRYLTSSAPVDEHLADQLLLPMALAGGGKFSTVSFTQHFHTNVETVTAFLPVKVTTSPAADSAVTVVVSKK